MSLMKQRTIYMGEKVPASIVLDEGRLEVRRIDVELLSLNDSDSEEDERVVVNGTRKRRRLTNLSPEEKMLRRKLKNRMAAQTARDRKKQKMAELEDMLALIQAENQKLAAENETLRHSTTSLTRENEMLKERLQSPEMDLIIVEKSETDIKEEVVETGAYAVCTERLSEPLRESAELKPQQRDAARTVVTLLTTFCLFRVITAISLLHSMAQLMGAVRQSSSRSHTVVVKREEQNCGGEPPPSDPSLPPWWGSHQRSWNPSKN